MKTVFWCVCEHVLLCLLVFLCMHVHAQVCVCVSVCACMRACVCPCANKSMLLLRFVLTNSHVVMFSKRWWTMSELKTHTHTHTVWLWNTHSENWSIPTFLKVIPHICSWHGWRNMSYSMHLCRLSVASFGYQPESIWIRILCCEFILLWQVTGQWKNCQQTILWSPRSAVFWHRLLPLCRYIFRV